MEDLSVGAANVDVEDPSAYGAVVTAGPHAHWLSQFYLAARCFSKCLARAVNSACLCVSYSDT